MTYDAQEISVQSGAPVELYTFSHGASTYRYTSRESDYTDTTVSPNRTYTTTSIERNAIEATPEQARNALKLTVPRTNSVAELFRVAPPSDSIVLTLRRVHRGDTASVTVAWVGRVIGCTFEGAKAILQAEPISVSLKRSGLRRLYGATCPHVLYGDQCGLAKASYDTSTTVSAIDGLTLTVGALGAYTYAGGFVEWTNDDGNVERRFIESATNAATSPDSNDLVLTQAFAGIAVSDTVIVYPGCDHTLTTCDTTFSNEVNFGGWPYFPKKNPFGANPVY